MGNYGVIVVDPPWSYGSDTGRPNRTAEAHYRTMGNAGREINRRTGAGVEGIIQETPVADLAAPNSHLYLWTTNPKLPFAFSVMAAWGFTYKTTLTWVKSRADGGIHGGGMGWFYRGATEHILFGVKGTKPIPEGMRKPNAFLARPTGHSAKPDAFYEMLEGIYGEDECMADLYARRTRPGWLCWGDELTPRPGDLVLNPTTGVIGSAPGDQSASAGSGEAPSSLSSNQQKEG